MLTCRCCERNIKIILPPQSLPSVRNKLQKRPLNTSLLSDSRKRCFYIMVLSLYCMQLYNKNNEHIIFTSISSIGLSWYSFSLYNAYKQDEKELKCLSVQPSVVLFTGGFFFIIFCFPFSSTIVIVSEYIYV